MPRNAASYIPTDLGRFKIAISRPVVPQLYLALRGKILKMELKPGDRVSEIDLASAAQVSRTPARQAIKQLISENLLISKPSRGTWVAPINADRLGEALLIRRRLEPWLAAELARNPDRAPIVALLRATIAIQRDAFANNAVATIWRTDETFHKTICARGMDSLIWQVIRQARTEADRLQALGQIETAGNDLALTQHIEITDAIAAGDPEQSQAAMDRHMDMNETLINRIMTENPACFTGADNASVTPWIVKSR